uniref:Uncharacterized protein n=1 Tax=Avena sativa TaxID=4498 RepID=A0ACD5Y9V8_AVESA
MGAGPDRPAGTPPRPRAWRRGAARPDQARAHPVDSPPRPGARHALGLGTDRLRARHAPAVDPYEHNGSPLSTFIYLCAALGSAVIIWLCESPLSSASYVSLQGYRGLAAVVVATLTVILFRRHPPRLADQELPDRPNQIPAASTPRTQQLRPARLTLTGSILDAGRVDAAIRSSMADITRPCPAVSPPRAASSDTDDGGRSSSNGDEIVNYWYTSVHHLDAGGARLIVPGFIQQLEEMVRGLPQADAVELLRRAFVRDAKKSDSIFSYRLFDVVQNQCAICADPHGLTDTSTGTLVMTTKITAKLLQLISFELDEQKWLCQEVKKECFRQIVGQSVEKLLDVAVSLSNARFSADHRLTILDALVDVLYNISGLPLSRADEVTPNQFADILDLPLNRYEPVHNVVAHIFCKMVVDFRGILEATTADTRGSSSRELAIHPATVILVRYMEFFNRNGETMQTVLGTGDCTIELAMISSWISKLVRDAKTMFPKEIFHARGQRYIFSLNNIFCVYQMRYHPHPGGFLSELELQSLCSLIDQYIKSYLEEYWVPLVRYLDVDSLKMPCRSSLDSFLDEFFNICDSQMTWKARTELKKMLREQIVELVVPKYEIFLTVLKQEIPSFRCPCWSNGGTSEKPMYTAAWLEQVIKGFFER